MKVMNEGFIHHLIGQAHIASVLELLSYLPIPISVSPTYLLTACMYHEPEIRKEVRNSSWWTEASFFPYSRQCSCYWIIASPPPPLPEIDETEMENLQSYNYI